MTNNEMPNEIYCHPDKLWANENEWGATRYIRADSQPADVAGALAIADARGDEVKELDFGNVFWACGVLAEKVRALIAQQHLVNARNLDAKNEKLRGALKYILAQSKQNYPQVLKVIELNAQKALEK